MAQVTSAGATLPGPGTSYQVDEHIDPLGIMKQHDSTNTLGLSPAQVAGSALAAMSAALVASWAGTTGTVIGAAVGSVVATTGAATYTWSLRRTGHAVRRTSAQPPQTPLAAQVPEAPTARRSLPWAKVLLAGAAVTAATLGGITTFEALTGQPVSSLNGRGDAGGTSVGSLIGSGDEVTGKASARDQDTDPSETSSESSSGQQTVSPAEPSTDAADPATPVPTTPDDAAEESTLPQTEAAQPSSEPTPASTDPDAR